MTEKTVFSELIERLAASTGLSKQASHDALKDLSDIISDGLQRDQHVRLKGFGVFNIKPVADRQGINPRTGEKIIIPAHNKTTFKPDNVIKHKLNPQLSPNTFEVKRGFVKTLKDQFLTNRYYQIGAAAVVALLLIIASIGQKEVDSIVPIAEPEPPAVVESAVMAPVEPPLSDSADEPVVSAEPEVVEDKKEAPDPVETPKTTRHAVVRGESLWSLAEKYYDDPYLWPLIYQENVHIMENPDILEVGDQIEIPDLTDFATKSTAAGKVLLAEGNMMVYFAYSAAGNATAIDYLSVAVQLDSGIAERYDIDNSAIELLISGADN